MEQTILHSDCVSLQHCQRNLTLSQIERFSSFGMYCDSSVCSTFGLITLSVVTVGITIIVVPCLVFSLSSGELTGGAISKVSYSLLSSSSSFFPDAQVPSTLQFLQDRLIIHNVESDFLMMATRSSAAVHCASTLVNKC